MTWDHLPDWIKPDLWLDESHAIQYHATSVSDTARSGALFIHRNKQKPGEWCIGGFQWAGTTGPNWTLVSMEPLHVEPSILCHSCGDHGFIWDGKWMPA